MIMRCENCSSQIVLGKGSNPNEKWCPKCEGFEILSREESINVYNELIKEGGQKLKQLADVFSPESLITTLLVTREGFLLPIIKGFGFDSFGYVALTELISKIVKRGSNGTKICQWMDSDFQELIHIAQSHHQHLRSLLLIKNNLGSVVRVPPSSLRNVTYDIKKYEQIHGIIDINGLENELVNVFKFHDEWEDIMNNLYENGFISSSGAYDNQVKNKHIPESFEEHFKAIQVKISFELAMKDMELFDQDKFKNNPEYIELLDILGDHFYKSLIPEMQTPLEFKCTLISTSKNEFDNIIIKLGYDVLKTYDLLVVSSGKKISFPLIYDSGDEFLIPPLTLKIFKMLLTALYSQELMDRQSKDGKSFERKVCHNLEKVGLNINQPNDCTKKLTNIVDNITNPSLEIDIVAYNYQTNKLFVIDCKNILFSSAFILGKREEDIYKKLGEQPEKQRKRIEYMKNNLALFGLSQKRIKKYVSVLITANKEPIDILEDCHIISLRELHKIGNLEPFT